MSEQELTAERIKEIRDRVFGAHYLEAEEGIYGRMGAAQTLIRTLEMAIANQRAVIDLYRAGIDAVIAPRRR